MSSLVLSGDTSGTVTMSVPSISGTNTVSVQAGTGTMSLNTLMTAQNSTSGTSIDFTGIPSWAKRVTVMFQGVSTNGTSIIQIQIGAGSVTTTGYLGAGGYFQNANVTGSATFTSGFAITAATAATCVFHGSMVITLLGSNAWVANGAFARSDNATNNFGQGSISLGGTLDRVRITTVNGTDTFDAGSINVLYEG